MITGDLGAGKTVAVRAALAELDQARSTIIYLGNPAVGARGLYHGIVTALGAVPRFHRAGADLLQTTDLLAAEEHGNPAARHDRDRRSTPPRCWTNSKSCVLLMNAELD